MNQFESMVIVQIVGFVVASLLAYLPSPPSPFKSAMARNYFGISVWMLMNNIWPLLSYDELVNLRGEPFYPLFGFATILGFIFFLLLAIRSENKEE